MNTIAPKRAVELESVKVDLNFEEFSNIRSEIGNISTVGYCCGAHILNEKWQIPYTTSEFGDAHDIRYGFDPSKSGKLSSYVRGLDNFPNVYVLRDTTFIIFARGHTHEEVIEYLYTEEYRNTHEIHGFTINDPKDGVVGIVWVDA